MEKQKIESPCEWCGEDMEFLISQVEEMELCDGCVEIGLEDGRLGGNPDMF